MEEIEMEARRRDLTKLDGKLSLLLDELEDLKTRMAHDHLAIKDQVAQACTLGTGMICMTALSCVTLERDGHLPLLLIAMVVGLFAVHQKQALDTLTSNDTVSTNRRSSPATFASQNGVRPRAESDNVIYQRTTRLNSTPLELVDELEEESKSESIQQPVVAMKMKKGSGDKNKAIDIDDERESTRSINEESKLAECLPIHLVERDFSEPQVTGGVDGFVIKSEAEAESVQALRARLQDIDSTRFSHHVNLDDTCLIRYVRARKGNLKACEEMFRGALEWRESFRPDKVFKQLQEKPHPYMKYGLTGGWCLHDKEGSPLMIDPIARLDLPGLMRGINDPEEDLTEQDMIDFHIWRQEETAFKLLEAEQLSGRPQFQIAVITDLSGLGMKHFNKAGLNILKQILFIQDNYYCEGLKYQFIINAPRIFSAIWAIVKTFLDPNTRAKIQIFSNCPTEEILKVIDADKLPKYLGGNLVVDGDDTCSSWINFAAPFPRKK